MSTDVFVSSETITREPAKEIVKALREHGLSVFHSPPWDQEANWQGPLKKEWDRWYGPDLWRATEDARLIVLVVSPRWQNSSWMISECEAATRASKIAGYSKALTWNPAGIPITNQNHASHVGEMLPAALNEAVEVIKIKLRQLDKSRPRSP